MPIREVPNRLTVEGSYTGMIESPADKVYTIDPSVEQPITITSFFAKTTSGTCAALVTQTDGNVAVLSVSSSSGEYASAIANAVLAAGDFVKLTVSSASSAVDLVFRIGYEYEVDADE